MGLAGPPPAALVDLLVTCFAWCELQDRWQPASDAFEEGVAAAVEAGLREEAQRLVERRVWGGPAGHPARRLTT